MQFQKQDMEGSHYQWPETNEKILYIGPPSRRSFDPFNGDQVLFVINSYASLIDNFTVENGRQIERQLLYYLPATLKSEISVLNWLKTLELPALPAE
jgi:hypothetical protein